MAAVQPQPAPKKATVQNLEAFMEAVMHEHLCSLTDQVTSFYAILGRRMLDVQRGELEETNYILEFARKFPQ